MARIKGATFSKEKRKEILLNAALITFCKKGYDGTNIDEIAREANCSHGLLYYYFKSKDDIFFELVDIANQAIKKLSTFCDEREDENPIQSIKEITEMLFGAMKDNDIFYYYFQFITLLNTFSKENKNYVEKEKIEPFSNIKRLIELGQNKNQVIEGNIDQVYCLYISIIQGLCYRKTHLNDLKDSDIPTCEMIVNVLRK